MHDHYQKSWLYIAMFAIRATTLDIIMDYDIYYPPAKEYVCPLSIWFIIIAKGFYVSYSVIISR